MTEGVVVRLAKSQGEAVGQGEVIAEIETEKLSYDLEAVAGGRFHPVVDEGATVAVDALIAYVLEEGESAPSAEAPSAPTPSRARAERTPARRQSPARTPSGDAVRSTPGARRAAASLGVDISQVAPTGPGGRVVESDVRAFAERRDDERRSAPTPSTPGARRAAASLGVDISQIAPSGPRGRVVESDVRAFADAQAKTTTLTTEPPSAAAEMPPGLPAPARSEPLRGMRQGIARHMSDSLRGTAQLSYFLEMDVTEAQRLRREVSQSSDAVITLAHVLIKACAETLKRVPAVNSVLVDGVVHYFDQANIGVAVALADGLIVPVLRDTGGMSVFQISRATHDLATRARAGELSPDEVVGGTFTISVLGTVDGFTPILNSPQSGILGVGRSVEKPVASRGEIAVREMITLSLTADHQVIDGAIAAAFLRRLQATVERPARLFR